MIQDYRDSEVPPQRKCRKFVDSFCGCGVCRKVAGYRAIRADHARRARAERARAIAAAPKGKK